MHRKKRTAKLLNFRDAATGSGSDRRPGNDAVAQRNVLNS
jgi:hypothetical protein